MYIIYLFLLFLPFLAEAKNPDLSSKDVQGQMNLIMKAHAQHKKLTSELFERALQNYLEELDPTKTYFIEGDIRGWLHPDAAQIDKWLEEYNQLNFSVFFNIYHKLGSVIPRRHEIEASINDAALPTKVDIEQFKDLKWAANLDELKNRLVQIKALQKEAAAKLTDDIQERALQRIAKRQQKFEEEILTEDPKMQERFVMANTLKALASSLDSHTAYFTPDEASQFMIHVQQRLFGIGAQLRDDINGFTVVKIVEGGPASFSKELKAKDRIIAVNGEPVVGMDITEAVELIRGEENTPVVLTVIRENGEAGEKAKEEKLDITLKRGAVVLKETRYQVAYEPFGNGAIAYLRLYSFYQDPESSSAEDLTKELAKLKNEQNILGVVLDLRYNSGGMLSQAVNVTSLFIKKGTVVSIKDDTGQVQHLRDLEDTALWNGPLIVLVNRASASASEIVAQALQDYGRAIVVGDDHTFGKGSFQTFTLGGEKTSDVNPKGEFKVTRGRYYTVSGKSPQLLGVEADIAVPGALSEMEIGEKFGKYPLPNDRIKPNFDDDLADIPFLQRDKIRLLYKFDLQKPLTTYRPYMVLLKSNSAKRIENNKLYQKFLKSLKKEASEVEPDEEELDTSTEDFQLQETYNIMRDLLYLEGVAKLLYPEKSMILRPVASGSHAATVHSTRSTPGGLAEENECKWPQKGDFAGQMSFATPSLSHLSSTKESA
jgi:carboxyl-terminal processing protease